MSVPSSLTLVQDLLDLAELFAETEHEAGLRDGSALVCVRENLVAAWVAGLHADLSRQARHGFQVVGEDVGIRSQHGVDMLHLGP